MDSDRGVEGDRQVELGERPMSPEEAESGLPMLASIISQRQKGAWGTGERPSVVLRYRFWQWRAVASRPLTKDDDY